MGSIVLYVHGEAADCGHLRWFVIHAKARGQGGGGDLMDRVMAHARRFQLSSIYLTTFSGLAAARHLYEKVGFVLTQTQETDPWSGTVGLQRFE